MYRVAMPTAARLALALLLSPAAAATCRAAGGAAAPFLAIGAGARACGMGEAFAGLVDDASAVHWNPAGLARAPAAQVLLGHSNWLLDMGHQYAAAAASLGPGTVGCAAVYSSSGDMPRVENFRRTGDYSAYDVALSAAYAAELAPGLAVGGTAKWIHLRLESESASSPAADLGVLYVPPKWSAWRLALSVHHVGPGLRFIAAEDPLPRTLRLAVAYQGRRLALGVQGEKAVGAAAAAGLGAEYALAGCLALRGGIHSVRSWSAGLGLSWAAARVDVAYVANRYVEAVQVLSLSLAF